MRGLGAERREAASCARRGRRIGSLRALPRKRNVVKATQLGRSFPGDPADRLIVASALLAPASLVTKDEKIRAYPAVDAVW